MEIVSVTVDKRSEGGKGPARRARACGKIPGVFYGPNQREAITLQVDEKEFAKKIAVLEGSALIQFDSLAPELKSRMVLLREVQSHPVSGAILHADFYEVDLTKKLEVTVALHFAGKAIGVEAGGILQPIVREITVKCLPTEIPAFIEVDVSEPGSSLVAVAFPTAFAFAAVANGLSIGTTLAATCFSWVENQVSAALRGVPLA